VMTKVRFESLDPRILPEMSAKVSFLSQAVTAAEQQPLLALNPKAVVQRDGASAVFRLEPDDTVALVPVTLGRSLGETVELKSTGLKAGDRLVLSPPDKLRPAGRVSVAAAGGK
jgi:HlyD family secretion protein